MLKCVCFLYKHFSEIKVQFFILGFSHPFCQNIIYECIVRVHFFVATVTTKIEHKLHKYTFICLSDFMTTENPKPDTPDPSTNTQTADMIEKRISGSESFDNLDSLKNKKKDK